MRKKSHYVWGDDAIASILTMKKAEMSCSVIAEHINHNISLSNEKGETDIAFITAGDVKIQMLIAKCKKPAPTTTKTVSYLSENGRANNVTLRAI